MQAQDIALIVLGVVFIVGVVLMITRSDEGM